MTMSWAFDGHRPYLWGRKDNTHRSLAALTWLFKSRALSSKLRR